MATRTAQSRRPKKAATTKPDPVIVGEIDVTPSVQPSPESGTTEVNPPVDDDDEVARQALMAAAEMPVVMDRPAEIGEAPEGQPEPEEDEEETLVAPRDEAAFAEAALPAEVRVVVLKCAQEPGFPVFVNGKQTLLHKGVACRIPRELLGVLDDSDVDYEIVE